MANPIREYYHKQDGNSGLMPAGIQYEKITTWKYHVDDSTEIRYCMIQGRDPLTALGLDLKFYEHIIIGGDRPHEGKSAPMADVTDYKLKYLTDKIIKPEKSFINSYANE